MLTANKQFKKIPELTKHPKLNRFYFAIQTVFAIKFCLKPLEERIRDFDNKLKVSKREK